MSEPSLQSAETQPENRLQRHEERDVKAAGILLAAGLLVAVGIIVHLAVWGLFGYLNAPARHDPTSSPFEFVQDDGSLKSSRLPDQPRLEGIGKIEERRNRSDQGGLYGRELQHLKSYGWVNQEEGIVHLPIQEAMRMIVEHKLLPAHASGPPKGPSGRASGAPSRAPHPNPPPPVGEGQGGRGRKKP